MRRVCIFFVITVIFALNANGESVVPGLTDEKFEHLFKSLIEVSRNFEKRTTDLLSDVDKTFQERGVLPEGPGSIGASILIFLGIIFAFLPFIGPWISAILLGIALFKVWFGRCHHD